MGNILPFKGIQPKLHTESFIAPDATVIGDVHISEYSSIWFKAVLRGDVNHIRVGPWSNIQDGSVVHCNGTPSHPTIIHSHVTVGHGAMIHGCELHNACLIGIGAIILNGAVVEENALVAAGAVVREGQRIPAGHLAAGVPAKIIRPLEESEKKKLFHQAEHYWNDLAVAYR